MQSVQMETDESPGLIFKWLSRRSMNLFGEHGKQINRISNKDLERLTSSKASSTREELM